MQAHDYSYFGNYYDYCNHREYVAEIKKAKAEKIEPNPQKP